MEIPSRTGVSLSFPELFKVVKATDSLHQ